MLTLVEEIILLTLEDKSGKFIHVPEHCIRYALSGAVLMELAFLGRIDTDPKRLFVTDREPVDDDLLDPVLGRICGSKEQHDCSYWIVEVGRDAKDIRERALERLCDNGILNVHEDLFLWVFRSRRYPSARDGSSERKEVKLRMMSLLFSDEIPAPRDIAIMGLADTCGIFARLLARPERERARARIDAIRKLELIARTVNGSVFDIEIELARAMTMRPY
ncbi:GPP34 family phosphoprotein [Nitratireductor sp. XY-223]|uniref:GOLPH3/VPS74 family protein n=1 Tax=Nitratireductor sp. XY-223 TaxID=2561926 RepID=UPI0010AB3B24|nr:GPP34 family phosphoprotein [Nitratireductor sp. XY-223]